MKIKNIYTYEDNFGKLTLTRNNSFKKIEKFFEKYPVEYCDNYYFNKETLKIYEVDDTIMEGYTGLYESADNFIQIKDVKNALTHELLHMSSNDLRNEIEFGTYKSFTKFLVPIVEGITEFLSSEIDNRKISSYYLESFCSKMLFVSDNSLLKYYFTADNDGFYQLYNEIDLLNLIYNLSRLTDSEITGNVRDNVHVLFHSLLNIELSKEKDPKKLMLYRDLFLDLLNTDNVKLCFDYCFKDYHTYAKKLVDRKFGIRK